MTASAAREIQESRSQGFVAFGLDFAESELDQSRRTVRNERTDAVKRQRFEALDGPDAIERLRHVMGRIEQRSVEVEQDAAQAAAVCHADAGVIGRR